MSSIRILLFSLVVVCSLWAEVAPVPVVRETPVAVAVLTQGEQNALLQRRLPGELGLLFTDFANMFVVKSNIELGTGVGLMTASPEVAGTNLTPAFPESYQPTLRQLLDIIALQTGSSWSYDVSGKFIRSDSGKQPKEFVVFEFVRSPRVKPYEVTLAKGWEAVDKGSWTMCRPAVFPVGLDIYEVGEYSSDEAKDEAALLERVPVELSLEWACRVKPGASRADFGSAKVGPYDAVFFEAQIPSRVGGTVHWRQWIFMVNRRCYFVVSTIFPEYEEKLFPEVEAALRSFRLRQ